MTTAICFGAAPEHLWLSLDGRARRDRATGYRLLGGAQFVMEAEPQVFAVTAMAGYVGEIDLLSRRGVAEHTHARFLSTIREVHPRHDHAFLDAIQRQFPEDVIDRGQAARDAARMLSTERLRRANTALRGQLLRRGELGPEEIMRALVPFELPTFLNGEGIRIWAPSAEGTQHSGSLPPEQRKNNRYVSSEEDFFDKIEDLRGDFGVTASGRESISLDNPVGLRGGRQGPRRRQATQKSTAPDRLKRQRGTRRSGPGA